MQFLKNKLKEWNIFDTFEDLNAANARLNYVQTMINTLHFQR